MKPAGALGVCAVWLAALACACAAGAVPARAATLSPGAALARWSAAWRELRSYECTIQGHEVFGSRTQDGAYRLYFVKPRDTRMDVIAGSNVGGSAVWTGGAKLRGHRGGFLKGIVLTLGLHSSLVSSLRGTTIDQANFGALLRHFEGVKHSAIAATISGNRIVVSQTVADPASDDHVTREVVTLGPNGLPTEFDQFEGKRQVERFRYLDVKLNAAIPASTFSL